TQRIRSATKCTGCVNYIINEEYVPAFDLPDDVHHLGFVLTRTALVDHGEIRPQSLGVRAGNLQRSDIRRHYRRVLNAHGQEVLDEYGRTKQMVNRYVEETLNLRGVEIHRQYAIY